MGQTLEIEDHMVVPADERQCHGNKGAEQSRRQNLRCTDSGPVGMRRHAMAIGSDVQYRDLLHLRGDQNSELFAFLVHATGCH